MSYGSELRDEIYIEEALEEDRMLRGDWRTKDGELINVRDMTGKHLLNCYDFTCGDDWSYVFRGEIERRLYDYDRIMGIGIKKFGESF